MTEEQARLIIALLKEIADKIPSSGAYSLDDIHSDIGGLQTAVDRVRRAVESLEK